MKAQKDRSVVFRIRQNAFLVGALGPSSLSTRRLHLVGAQPQIFLCGTALGKLNVIVYDAVFLGGASMRVRHDTRHLPNAEGLN